LTMYSFCDFVPAMPVRTMPNAPSRGHKKRARTREQLVAAGVAVLAERGEALTISDVTSRAQVSNGTFYNYFTDRDELIDALVQHSLAALAASASGDTAEMDPALRFAVATGRVLKRAAEDPTWGRAVLRLSDHRRSFPREVGRFLKVDLAAGCEQGRFDFGPDEITLDAVTGLIAMTIRRIVRGEAGPGHVKRVVERAFRQIGIEAAEAVRLAAEAADESTRPDVRVGRSGDLD